jgi:uncharacterized RDD family membrane protein YckC
MLAPAGAAALARERIAGFWIRVAADLLDALILGAFGYLLSLPLRTVFLRLGEGGVFVGLGISLVYAGVLQSRIGGGQTLAKRILGLRVVRLDGSLLSLDRSLIRYATVSFMVYQGSIALAVTKVLPFLRLSWVSTFAGTLSLVLFLGCVLVVPAHPLRRGLHDLLVGTIVVRRGMPDAEGLAVLRASSERLDRAIVVGAAALLVVSTALGFVFSRPAARLPAAVAQPARLAREVPLENAGVVDRLAFENGTRHRAVIVTGFLPALPDGGRPDFERAHRLLMEALRRELVGTPDIDSVGTALRTGFHIGIYSSYETEQRIESATAK